MRFFGATIDERRQPVLLKGEIERAVLHNANLDFEGMVGGVEGYLNDKYVGGFAVLTNYRIIWVSYQPPGSSFDGVPCHLPLAAISESELQSSFLKLKSAKVKLHIRLDSAGYPSLDPLTVARVIKIKIFAEKPSSSSGGTDTKSWYSALQGTVSRQAWKNAPLGLMQEMSTRPPVTTTPQRSKHQSIGPMTPPPNMLESLSLSGSMTQHFSGNITPHGSVVMADPGMLQQLQHMGYTEGQARAALQATRNASVQQAANWLLDNPNASAGVTGTAAAAASPAHGQREFQFATPSAPPPPPFGDGATVMNPLLQPEWSFQQKNSQQQQLTPPQVTRSDYSNVGIGIAGVLKREEKRAQETDRILGAAFTDLNQLMASAEEMVKLAEAFRVRAQRAKTEGNEEESKMDDALATELADLGITSPVTRESCGKLYYSELARQLAAVMEIPVAESGGVLPLPEVYRRFCRARFTDLISPDDLIQAVRKLPDIGSTLRLKEFPSGVKALVAGGASGDYEIWQKILEIAVSGSLDGNAVVVNGTEESSKVWLEALGPGVSRSEVAAALGVPLPLAGEHLAAAEAVGLLCRDDGPEGLRYYKNFFKETTSLALSA